MELLNDIGNIAGALLMIVGGLKIAARYTKWEWDDRLFEALEKCVTVTKDVVDKIKPKKDEDK